MLKLAKREAASLVRRRKELEDKAAQSIITGKKYPPEEGSQKMEPHRVGVVEGGKVSRQER